MSNKGCASFFVIMLIGLWTAVMGGLMAVGWLGSGLIELIARAVFGDTPEAQGIVDGTLAFVRGTAGSFLGLIWGLGMARFTDAAAPMIDAAIAGTSVAAQILLARRRIENWVLWILVDLAAVPLFWSRGLLYTSGLYALFLILSIAGLIGWTRQLRAQGRAA